MFVKFCYLEHPPVNEILEHSAVEITKSKRRGLGSNVLSGSLGERP
jgi:hypothetical protein